MARHRIGDAIYSLRHNQIDRRRNGIYDYSQSDFDGTEGPGSVTVGSSGSDIVVDVSAFEGQIEGEDVDFASQSVSLDDNPESDQERIDVIVGPPSGEVEPWKGDTYPLGEDDDGNTLEGRQNPESQPPALGDLEGVVLAAVRIPPSASNTSDLSQDDIHDLRRPALEAGGGGGLSVLGLPYSSLEGGGGDHSRVGQALIVPPDTTLEVHSWGHCWKEGNSDTDSDEPRGTSGPETGHILRLLSGSHEELESTNSFWESGGGDPLFSIANDGTEPEVYQVQLLNDEEDDFTWQDGMRGLSANVYYRLV